MYKRKFLKLLLPFAGMVLMLGACVNNSKEPVTTDLKESDPKIEKLKLPSGFHAQHLYGPSENGNGSWVSMAFDNKGRLIASDQYGALYRLELPPIGADTAVSKLKIEKLQFDINDAKRADGSKPKVEMGYAQGLLWAFNSLYVMVNHNADSSFEKGSGLYRLQDTNNDDQFDKITLLKSLDGEGEHGPHSIKLSPDGSSLYVIAGNHTDVPEMNAYRLPKVWKEDNLFPLVKDPSGHANNRYAPGGWIARVDSSGTDWELISAGYRNAFDIAFNAAGELFAYDSDMEYDIGMPWYRPTRICHVTSGSEFGWRTGNSKWPASYPDNLPAVINIGQGSPTNLVSTHIARFPEKFSRTLLAFDWSFGIIYAVHLQEDGSTYTAKAEEFLSGVPLPLTDGIIGPDGALYFATGGRRLDSDLYRVYYGKGDGETANAKEAGPSESDAIKTRKKLEQFHGKPAAAAVRFAWPYLNNNDRFIRYAARIAVEHQPVSQWQDLALNEKDPHILTQAIIALARQGDKKLKSRLFASLLTIDYSKLSESQELDLLRAFELTISRMGRPDAAQLTQMTAYLNAHFPSTNNSLNRMYSKLLIFVQDPEAVKKTLDLIAHAKDDTTEQKNVSQSTDLILRNPQYGMDIAEMLSKSPPAQQIYLANVLSIATVGWTPVLREQYFNWYAEAFKFKGGKSYIGFIDKSRKTALASIPKGQLAHYNTISGDSLLNASGKGLAGTVKEWPKGPGRNWTIEKALPIVQKDSGTRNFEKGKNMFVATACFSCHGMRGEGGAIGPDLSQLGTRFSQRDILESILEPNKVISDQYAATIFEQNSGSSVTGRLIREDKDYYFISQNPFAPQTLKEIDKKSVSKTKPSTVSIMFPGLVNGLNATELKDLMAFLISGGDKNHSVYQAKK